MFNLFKKKKEGSNGAKYTGLKIREIIREAKDTVTLYFEQPEPILDYKAGQYLTVILDINGKEERRSYSLCTSPFVDPYPGITVKKVAGGLISNYLNDNLRPGKTIDIMRPKGNFTTTYHSKNDRHFVMVAGGSGITPIMGITKSVLVNEPLTKVTLLYCSRSEEEVIFKKQLDELAARYEGRLQVIHNLSQPSPSWTGLKGRMDATKIQEVLKDKIGPSSLYYLCGPEGLMASAATALKSLGVEEELIHKESFFVDLGAKEEEMKAAGKLSPELTREVEVVVDGEPYRFEVTAGQTILEAGLDHDVDMPYSCQSGLCTACRGKLLSGQVDMIEDAGLSQSEIEEGYILCCSSKPASSDIKIIIE
jgi:ring-1,2-phenylacetyl-CoA epoxidase subunit PaaE